jgi:hypothetical protein
MWLSSTQFNQVFLRKCAKRCPRLKLFSNYTVKMRGEEKVQFVIKVTLNRSWSRRK